MNFNNVLFTGGTFIHVEDHVKGFEVLKEYVASSAFHDSGEMFDPPKCHPNTRVAVIERIMDWISGKIDTDTLILWLYGPAGAGKSAIAKTIADLCHERGLLLATFFFSRTDPSRNNVKSLVATLAYKVLSSIPAARPVIEQIVESDPLILKCSIEAQFTKLILEPLAHLLETGLFDKVPFPPAIIIDGLEECIDQAAQRTVLDVISLARRKWGLPLKILVASRPERTIICAFKTLVLKPLTHHFPLNDDYKPDDDIRTFILARFEDIKRTHPLATSIPSSWPSKKDVHLLVAKSSGQFIYASIAMRFNSSLRHNPRDRLKIVLGLQPPCRDLPFVELDALYTQILSSSEDVETLLKILGVSIALSRSSYLYSIPNVERILHLEEGCFSLTMGDVNSLVECTSPKKLIKFHHASFPDFLLNDQRSRNLHVDVALAYSDLARWALRPWKDPAINGTDINHVWMHFIAYCGAAAPTPELHQDFWDLSLSDWASSMADLNASFATIAYHPRTRGMFSFAYLFVSGLDQTTFAEGEGLHARHRASLNQYMVHLSQDHITPDTLALFLLLGTGRLTPSSDWEDSNRFIVSPEANIISASQDHLYHGSFDTFQDAILVIFRLSRADFRWERKTINLLQYQCSPSWTPLSSHPPVGYEDFLLNFFSHHQRPEGLRFDDHRYAALGLICVRYLCGPSIDRNHDPRLQPFSHWIRASRNSPWLWRKLRRSPHLLASVRRKWRQWRRIGVRRCALGWDALELGNGKRVDGFSEEQDPYRDFKHRWADTADRRSLPLRTFALALHLLPRLLAQSPKSEQLVDMLSRAVFHPTSIIFVHRTRRAREAIREYLERVGR